METDRYIRQIKSHPEFHQGKLSQAVVLIVGLGGLGSAAAMYLSAAGVGNMILCDYDTISISNLNRQILYSETEVGQKKVKIAVAKLSRINPDNLYIQLDEKFSRKTSMPSLAATLILDCLDNFQGRVDLAEFAFQNNIPLVHGAIHGFQGQMTFYMPGLSACPVCIAPDEMIEDNTVSPAVGPCAGFIGSMQALETIKYFTGIGDLFINRFMLFNGLTGCFQELKVKADPHCPACSNETVQKQDN